MLKPSSLVSILALIAMPVFAQSAPADQDADYTRVITGRAEKIVAPLGISDSAKATRVRDAVAQHYRNLRDIDDARDAQITVAKTAGGDSATIAAAKQEAELKRFAAHREFLGKLYAELALEQIEVVKDGLTYGVYPNTFRVYCDMLPDLTDAQRAQLKAWLAEAREYAMDGGSSEEKHKWFGKYKGRINNYLSAAGYDMKQAERDLAERRKRAAEKNKTQS